MDDLKNLKKELDQTLSSAAESGERLVNKGHELSAAGQSIVDWAGATRSESKELTDRARIEDLIQSWKRTMESASYLNVQLSGMLGLVTSTADASSVSSMLNLSVDFSRRDVAFYGATETEHGAKILDLALRPEAHRAVQHLLKEMGFDRSGVGTIPAYDQFETAHQAYRINASSPNQATTWLIPIRECIHTVLSDLLRCRPQQEEAKGTIEKVASICRQLGRNGFHPGHFETLSKECKGILDEDLSPAKNRSLSRSESITLLMAATLWLKGFLTAIDPEKLGKAAR